jgi:ADP-ribose pyrophosphatase YjhB (NUDIX family)
MKRPIVTVGALVFNTCGEALFVLTHKWKNTYGIPGGKIEHGEEAWTAVIRELKEETGLRIKPSKVFLVQDCIDSREFYKANCHFILINYLATTKTKVVKLNDEAQSYLWMKPKEALKLKLNQPTRILVEAYLARRGSIHRIRQSIKNIF